MIIYINLAVWSWFGAACCFDCPVLYVFCTYPCSCSYTMLLGFRWECWTIPMSLCLFFIAVFHWKADWKHLNLPYMLYNFNAEELWLFLNLESVGLSSRDPHKEKPFFIQQGKCGPLFHFVWNFCVQHVLDAWKNWTYLTCIKLNYFIQRWCVLSLPFAFIFFKGRWLFCNTSMLYGMKTS